MVCEDHVFMPDKKNDSQLQVSDHIETARAGSRTDCQLSRRDCQRSHRDWQGPVQTAGDPGTVETLRVL